MHTLLDLEPYRVAVDVGRQLHDDIVTCRFYFQGKGRRRRASGTSITRSLWNSVITRGSM